jgi:sodium/hydrogen antiporter
MHDYPMILIMALLILGYGVFSKKAENSIITPPMVFVLMGLFVSYFMPNLLDQSPKAGYVKPVVEFTLILILFVDGSTIDRKSLWHEKSLPSRLLGIGLPLTMVLGTLAAMWIFPEENLYMLILLALILSPTDAALGQSVVTGEKVPKKIRQTINVESGLNDGFAYPPLLICISVLALQQGLEVKEGHLLTFLLKQFILGPAIGGIVGWLGGKLIEFALKKGMMTVIYQMLESFAIAVLAFFAAEYFGGNGFIAAFVAGMMLGTRREEARERMKEFWRSGKSR